MLNIIVRDVGPYKEISKDGIAFYGLLDEKEAVDMAIQLIEAAEQLLPITCEKEEIALSEVREELGK